MNDTFHMWNKVWMCKSPQPDYLHDKYFLATGVFLVVFTIVFYVSAYMQADERTRQLVQCKFH